LEKDSRCGKDVSKWKDTCYVFVNVKLMGFWRLRAHSEFGSLTGFARCKSRGGVYRVSYGTTLKLTSKTRAYGVYICYGKIRSRQS